MSCGLGQFGFLTHTKNVHGNSMTIFFFILQYNHMLIQCTMSCSGGNLGFLNTKYTHSVKDHPRHTLS